MSRKRSQERSQGEFAKSAEEMQARLWSWRRGEPEASFDEVMDRVRQEREALLKPLVEGLVSVAREFEVDVSCPACGGGKRRTRGRKRGKPALRGGSKVKSRIPFFSFMCARVFPLGSETGIEETGMESVDAADGVAPGG